MHAAIRAIEYHVPEFVLTNAQLASEYHDWSPEKIEEKTGIAERRIAGAAECSSDLGFAAAQKLFAAGACRPEEVDFLLLCTQSPDYFLPTTACLLQERLGIPTTAGALDFNLGCSGFVYGLSLAKGLVETGQAANVLLITAETYSKFIHPGDKSVRTLFGDGAAATLVQSAPGEGKAIGPFVFGTDGRGGANLVVPVGGLRRRTAGENAQVREDEHGNRRGPDNLYMNGAEILGFTLQAVPQAVKALLEKAELTPEEVDLFVLHQANRYMLEHLRKKMRIPAEKFPIRVREFGNTVSSTIPILLKQLAQEGQIRPGQRVMLVGFGVGYSWGAVLVRWQ